MGEFFVITEFCAFTDQDFGVGGYNDTGHFRDLGIQDLDGANLLIHLESLELDYNPITSIERGDFGALINLRELSLNDNQVMSIENSRVQNTRLSIIQAMESPLPIS